MIKWLKYSGVWAGVVLNPYHWRLGLKFLTKDEYEQFGVCYFEINLGPVWVRVVIDDGRW